MTVTHNHTLQALLDQPGNLMPVGKCPACDDYRFRPEVSSKAGEPLEVEVELADDASMDEIAAAMQAAAREAGLL